MSEFDITLEDETEKIQDNRQGEKVIMEEFRKNPLIKSSEMKALNKCRLFLKVFMLSDITTGDGREIVRQAWSGKNFKCKTRESKYWPLWGTPTTSEWIRWRFALKSTFCMSHESKLNSNLGTWVRTPNQWQWFLTTIEKKRFY